MTFTSLFQDPFDLYDFGFTISHKIREEQRKNSEKAMKKLTKLIKKGEAICTLGQVQEVLISKGVSADKCQYHKNDFAEQLNVNLADTDFNLSIGLFPKDNRKQGISMTIAKANLHKTLDCDTTPESIADFILRIADWLPEYYAIEIRIQEEEMQKQTIFDLAIDLIKRNIGAILEEKGYKYSVSSSDLTNKASIRIIYSDIFKINLEVNLMEDFFNEVESVVKALPACKVKEEPTLT